MSKMNIEKRNLKFGKLSLNRETLRTISAESLEEVVSGWLREPTVTCAMCSLSGCITSPP